MKKIIYLILFILIIGALIYFDKKEYPSVQEKMGVEKVPVAVNPTLAEKVTRKPIVPDIPDKPKINRRKLTYEAFDVKTKDLIDRSYVDIKEYPTGEKHIKWAIVKDSYTHRDEYVLNPGWETLEWKVYLSDKGTEYTGTKEGQTLQLNGRFNNKELKKSIKLKKDLPFYYNPKLGLKGFLQSDQKEIEFWGFRGDNLTEYKMKAVKQGKKNIVINGEEFETMQIYWAATGIAEKFFNRVYYYRISDGEFLSQDPCDGWSMNLIDLKVISLLNQ